MRKRAVDVENAPLGMADFWQGVQGRVDSWAWIAVRSSLDSICQAYQERGWQIVATQAVTTPLDFAPGAIGCVEPIGHGYEWVWLLRAWGHCDREKIATEGVWLSDHLKTKVFWVAYDKETTYTLLEWGKVLEAASWGEKFTFASQLRNSPSEEAFRSDQGFTAFITFIEETIAALRIFVPACYIENQEEKDILVFDSQLQTTIGRVNLLLPPQ